MDTVSALREWFAANGPIVMFVYGQVFFVLGLAITLQTRRYSRLDLARSLPWLAAFGFSHCLVEWGDLFVPIQERFVSAAVIGGLRALLATQSDMQVVAEADSAEAALREAEQLRPQVVILDIRLPGRSGLEACAEIRRRFPEVRVVMLTSAPDDSYISEALRAGASGYVLKQVGGDELIRAVQAAARGETALDPQTAARVVARLQDLEAQAEANAFRELSPRELDVLVLVAEGKGNKEIGAALGLSDITVRNYVSNMLDKLHLTNRVELAAFAMTHRLLDRRGK